MSKIILKTVSLMMVILMIAAITGCKENPPEESIFSDYYEVVDGGDTETVITSSEQGGSSNATQGEQTSNTQSSTTSASSCDAFMKSMPKKLRGTTITYFYWWDPKQQMEKETIAAFEKLTGITVKTEVASYSEFTTELAAKISAGQAPDIVRLLSNAMYQVKSLQPITNSGYNFKDDCWNQQLMKDYTYNGKTYATNLNTNLTAVYDPWILYYNTKTIKSNDLEDPYTIWKNNPKEWTWEKLWSLSEQFLENNGHKAGYGGLGNAVNMYRRVSGGRYYDYDSSKGKWVNLMKDQALVNAYQDILVKSEKKLISTEGLAALERGKLLFLAHGPFPARKRDQNFQTLKKNGTLGAVPLPTDSKYYPLYEYTAFGIPQGAKNPEAVPYYLRYVLDKNNYDQSKIYENDKMRAVVEYAVTRNNMIFGENEVYALQSALMGGTAEQVKSTIDQYNGQIQSKVDDSNEEIKYLSK